jgi:hypothetical protein
MSKTNGAAKFSPMSPEQYAAIVRGGEVVAKSGKTYRCTGFNDYDSKTGKPLAAGQHPIPTFRQVREGKLFGRDFLALSREGIAAPVVDVAAIRGRLGLESRMYSDERILQIEARVVADEARVAAR